MNPREPHEGMTTPELERLRGELRVAMLRSAQTLKLLDELLATRSPDRSPSAQLGPPRDPARPVAERRTSRIDG